jgi:hypothetical protein
VQLHSDRGHMAMVCGGGLADNLWTATIARWSGIRRGPGRGTVRWDGQHGFAKPGRGRWWGRIQRGCVVLFERDAVVVTQARGLRRFVPIAIILMGPTFDVQE